MLGGDEARVASRRAMSPSLPRCPPPPKCESRPATKDLIKLDIVGKDLLDHTLETVRMFKVV